jgi:hypothetical protein
VHDVIPLSPHKPSDQRINYTSKRWDDSG